MGQPDGRQIPLRYSIGLWLTAGGLAFLLCLYHLSATFVEGVFLPADHDSFYHARRIIDSLADPLRMYQFDPRIHAPEGSWLVWPWAYDTLMAYLASALMAATGTREPLKALALVAPAWVFVNAALLAGIASRLRLSLPMQVLALLFFALSSLTQNLHRVGMLDHHFVEYTFVLSTIYLGLAWFENLADRRYAVALAVVLGAAPAFHNGLFVLQVPVLLAVASLWALKRPLDRTATLAFALALVATTAAFLLPSEPFRRGEFTYYLHSGFHLYVAFCTGLLSVLASRISFSRAAIAGVAVLMIVLALPTLQQLVHGRDFLFAKLPYLENIGELSSIPREIGKGGLIGITRGYSGLVWLLPLTLGALCWRLRRDSGNASIYFTVQALVGTFLLLQTFRLHYFGSFVLILPLCRLIDDARELRPALLTPPRTLAVGGLVVAALIPGVLELRKATPLANDFEYMLSRQIYLPLEAACRANPGVVLAEHGDGHYIRYHSECSVISNNFILTPLQIEKIALSEELLRGSLADVRRRAPYVRYLLVRRGDNVLDESVTCGADCPENAGLRRELLRDSPPATPGLRLVGEVRVPRGSGKTEPLVRLFELAPP